MDFAEQYFRTSDGRIGFWDPLASALAHERTFHVLATPTERSHTITPNEHDLTPIDHHPVYVVLLERGRFRRVSNHPTEAGARDTYSSHFLGRTYDGHLHTLTEMLVPIASTSEHEQWAFESDFTYDGYYPDWARTTLTWASAPSKVPRASYAARVVSGSAAGWVDRDAAPRPDGKVPLYLGDRVRWESPADLATDTLAVYALNWVDGDGDCYPYGALALSEDAISISAPDRPTIDCRKLELRQWQVPGISTLDEEGDRVAGEFITRSLAYGVGGACLDWNDVA